MSAVRRRRVLASAAATLAGGAALSACGDDGGSGGSPEGGSTGDSPGDSSGGSSGSSSGGGSDAVASTADVPEGGGLILEDPQVVITQPEAGEFKAFSAICTHQGCPVTGVTETIDCSCHGSKFSLADGSALEGPATDALEEQAITVRGKDIRLG